MANQITETTLEMHYHHAMMELFKSTFGLGPNGHFEFFKYSTQKEKFVGFDQAYVKTDLSDTEFLMIYQPLRRAQRPHQSTLGTFCNSRWSKKERRN